jgi:hypothetical protein
MSGYVFSVLTLDKACPYRHSKVSITLDIYGHLMSEMQSEAADLMDELITSVPIELHRVAPEK